MFGKLPRIAIFADMKRIWLIAVMAALVGVAGCQKDPIPGPEPVDPVVEPDEPEVPDEPDEPEEPEKPVPADLRVVYDAKDSTFYERTAFAEWAYDLKDPDMTTRTFNMFLQPKCKNNNEILHLRMKEETGAASPSWGYWDYIIHYESTDSRGQPITLSERVLFPAGDGFAHKAKGLLLVNRPTLCANAECPTVKKDYLFGLASHDYVTVYPDLQGFGVSRERIHPYLCAEITARHTLDGLLAVLHFLRDREIELQEERELMNVGYSQGGASALAVHKYLENNCSDEEKELLPLKASYCGGGPYDLQLTMKVYQETEDLAYPCALPLIILGMKEGFPDIMAGIEPEDYFTDKVVKGDVLDWTRDKEHSAAEITSRIQGASGTHQIAGMLSDKMADPSSKEYKALEAAMAANNLVSGWMPVHPVHLCHVPNDEIVPYANSEKAMEVFAGGPVSWIANFTPLMQSHVGGAAGMYLLLLDGFPE